MGRGTGHPCPELEDRAVLPLLLALALGIVTRRAETSNKRMRFIVRLLVGSVSEASRARPEG